MFIQVCDHLLHCVYTGVWSFTSLCLYKSVSIYYTVFVQVERECLQTLEVFHINYILKYSFGELEVTRIDDLYNGQLDDREFSAFWIQKQV